MAHDASSTGPCERAREAPAAGSLEDGKAGARLRGGAADVNTPASGMKKLLPLRVPWRIKTAFEAFVALEFRYGRFRSAGAGRSIDGHGTPIPWYSYPAIEYLKQLDFRDRTVFEFGSGNSTLFWAARARQ